MDDLSGQDTKKPCLRQVHTAWSSGMAAGLPAASRQMNQVRDSVSNGPVLSNRDALMLGQPLRTHGSSDPSAGGSKCFLRIAGSERVGYDLKGAAACGARR